MTTHDLDGVYFQVERDGKKRVLCFSDLTREEQEFVLRDWNLSAVKTLSYHLAKRLYTVGEYYNIDGGASIYVDDESKQ